MTNNDVDDTREIDKRTESEEEEETAEESNTISSRILVKVEHGEYTGKATSRAPETVRYARRATGGVYDGVAADIYSLGTILFTMLTNGIPPYKNIGDAYYMNMQRGGPTKVYSLLRSWGVDISEEAIDLCCGMMRRDPRLRFKYEDIISHPWLVSTTSTEHAESYTPEEEIISTQSILPATTTANCRINNAADNSTPPPPTATFTYRLMPPMNIEEGTVVVLDELTKELAEEVGEQTPLVSCRKLEEDCDMVEVGITRKHKNKKNTNSQPHKNLKTNPAEK